MEHAAEQVFGLFVFACVHRHVGVGDKLGLEVQDRLVDTVLVDCELVVGLYDEVDILELSECLSDDLDVLVGLFLDSLFANGFLALDALKDPQSIDVDTVLNAGVGDLFFELVLHGEVVVFNDFGFQFDEIDSESLQSGDVRVRVEIFDFLGVEGVHCL